IRELENSLWKLSQNLQGTRSLADHALVLFDIPRGDSVERCTEPRRLGGASFLLHQGVRLKALKGANITIPELIAHMQSTRDSIVKIKGEVESLRHLLNEMSVAQARQDLLTSIEQLSRGPELGAALQL